MNVGILLSVLSLVTYGSCVIGHSKNDVPTSSAILSSINAKLPAVIRKSLDRRNVSNPIPVQTKKKPLETDTLINRVNKMQDQWKAGRNFQPSLDKSYVKNLLGQKTVKKPSTLKTRDANIYQYYQYKIGNIPEYFDARKKWFYCKSLQEIRNQGVCGSCWAVTAASTLTDRYCIATRGRFNGHLSAEDLLTCCEDCGAGCDGGDDDMAWYYFETTGVVTGGDYGSREGCRPYTFPPCEHHVNGSRISCQLLPSPVTPPCKQKCDSNRINYEHDRVKVFTAYTLDNITAIQRDILLHGPVQAAFSVYTDFLSYKNGIYEYTEGGYEGEHSVKIVGWGKEKGVEYWLCLNSWDYDWGIKGTFKIKKGQDECGIEEKISAGIPIVPFYYY